MVPPALVDSPSHSTTRAPRKSTKRLVPLPTRKLHKRTEDKWDESSLNALRSYAPLSRDEETGAEVDWQHLTQGSNPGNQEESASSESGTDSNGYASVDSRDTVKSSSRAGRGVHRQHSTSRMRKVSRPRDAVETRYSTQDADARRQIYGSPTGSGYSHPRSERDDRPRDTLVYDDRPRDTPVYDDGRGRHEYFRPSRHSGISARADDYDSDEERRSYASDTTRSAQRSSKAKRQYNTSKKKATRQKPTSALLPLVHAPRGHSIIKDVLEELEALKAENERLKKDNGDTHIPTQPAVLAYTSRIFYRIGGTLFLDEPRWEPGEGGVVVLQANNPIRNIGYYLDQHPEIAFAIYKEYSVIPPASRKKLEAADGTYRTPEPVFEFLSLIAPAMLEAVEEFVQKVPKFGDYFPFFDPMDRIGAPYLFMYYGLPYAAELLPDLEVPSRNLVKQLADLLDKSHGYEYKSARLQAEKGKVARHLVKYLFRPGDVLVDTTDTAGQAFIVTSWIEAPEAVVEDSAYEGEDLVQRKRVPRYGPLANSADSRKMTTYSWEVSAWCWLFDGVFQRVEVKIELLMSIGYDEESVSISDLNFCPLEHATKGTHELLEKRGKTFWSMRHRRFVSYLRSDDEDLNNIEDRYMVDTNAYKTLHRDSKLSKLGLHDDIRPQKMAHDQPPDGDALLVFEPTIMAYNLQEKTWRILFVDQITDIMWNKQAFKDLVVDPSTKELVQAVVMKQLNATQSTDFVIGKGNGLIMLLHGAPGTGKTFTAEGVAEFAEKPLLRVTCGDVGTKAETVDKRLRATFKLGKMWDCVVLLDEADVFLEERDVKDLNRNALVSVFLRALEYYDGILILTSNRVGTFDEAFKSRIQLALHYENLGEAQRKKIWRNFTVRIKTLDHEFGIDIDEINDHIDELGKEILNGREIRNAITIARQLAHFREETFQYSHLKHAIDVGSRFGKYLQDLRMDMTDDIIKQETGIRLSYTAVPVPAEIE